MTANETNKCDHVWLENGDKFYCDKCWINSEKDPVASNTGKPLNCDMDANRWTLEWLEQMKKTPEMASDFGSMIGWFSNSIMAGSDVTRWKMEKQIASLESSLEGMKKQISSMEFDRKNLLMFFQVATDALGLDPSCEPGTLDPMCAAEAVRGLRESLKTAEDKLAATERQLYEERDSH